MVDLIDATARKDSVDLFQRFAVMRHWRVTDNFRSAPSSRLTNCT